MVATAPTHRLHISSQQSSAVSCGNKPTITCESGNIRKLYISLSCRRRGSRNSFVILRDQLSSHSHHHRSSLLYINTCVVVVYVSYKYKLFRPSSTTYFSHILIFSINFRVSQGERTFTWGEDRSVASFEHFLDFGIYPVIGRTESIDPVQFPVPLF